MWSMLQAMLALALLLAGVGVITWAVAHPSEAPYPDEVAPPRDTHR